MGSITCRQAGGSGWAEAALSGTQLRAFIDCIFNIVFLGNCGTTCSMTESNMTQRYLLSATMTYACLSFPTKSRT